MRTRLETPTSVCRAAVTRADITPPVGFYHRMWGAATHEQATGVHRPLLATVLAIGPHDDSTSPVLIVAIDHCLLFTKESAAFRHEICQRTGIDPDHLLLTFSHTHAAGLLDPSRADRPGGEMIAPYLTDLAETVSTLIDQARASLQDATLTYGVGHCALAAHRDARDETSQQWVCGLNLDGPVDSTVLVARIDDHRQQPIASIVNYGCHPTTLAWANTLISPDYPGAMRETVEAATGAPCLFLLGACGDVGPRVGYVGDVAVADRNGTQLGHAALEAWYGLSPSATDYVYRGPVVSGATLGEWRHTTAEPARAARWSLFGLKRFAVPLPYRADKPQLDQLRAERGVCEVRKQAALDRGDTEAARDQHAIMERLSRAITRWEACPSGDTFPFQVALLRMGEAVWVFVESEPYQWLQTELRRRFPDWTIMVVVLLDGWRCAYLPRDEMYGSGVYPDQISMVARGGLEAVVDAIADEIAALS
ncbi:MAG TPA: hypothetical protein VFG20_02640 [Planctomycetaceae bacterium]|jgi:hypothetical protein|nr:hypothetical protein [Planctomycetaceae bacterium]